MFDYLKKKTTIPSSHPLVAGFSVPPAFLVVALKLEMELWGGRGDFPADKHNHHCFVFCSSLFFLMMTTMRMIVLLLFLRWFSSFIIVVVAVVAVLLVVLVLVV